MWYDREIQHREEILAQLPRGGYGVEVGVWAGVFSEQLLRAAHPKMLHLVDPWEYSEDPDMAGAGCAGRLAKSQQHMDELYESVVQRFASDIRVAVHRLSSEAAAALFEPRSLDWVYLDADHRYASVLSDLTLWNNAIKPGGILAGDDYGTTGWWGEGVTEAVDEFVASSRCTVQILSANQFRIRVP